MRKSISIAGRSRSPDDPLPRGGGAAGRLFPGLGPSVGLRPPFSPSPGNLLILIDGDSHLDCRAARRQGAPHRRGRSGWSGYPGKPCRSLHSHGTVHPCRRRLGRPSMPFRRYAEKRMRYLPLWAALVRSSAASRSLDRREKSTSQHKIYFLSEYGVFAANALASAQ